jgi:Hydrazine synthase alpha subunit middle domain/NedA-like, galactose-binding domain
MQRHRALAVTIAALAFAQARAQPPSAATRALVEADWERQDAGRMAQLQQPSALRFPDGVVQWAGLPQTDLPAIPRAAAPKLDGTLDDPCWQQALAPVPAKAGEPTFRLCHDGQRLYVAATVPKEAEPRYRGDVTAADASGAVDGVKNGLYAFHTGGDPNPWWQVDLGSPQPIARIVVYNRLDYAPGLHNADNLLFLTSDDGASWTPRHEHHGFFGGVSMAPPLTVELKDVTARYLRVQVMSPTGILFHLDEVEVYGPDDPAENLALHRPARQSTLSIWSRGGPMGSALFILGGRTVGLSEGDPPTLTVNGQPWADGAVARGEQGTVVELGLPLREGAAPFPNELRLAGDVRLGARLGAAWSVSFAPDAKLGFGLNHLALRVDSPGPLDPPLDLAAETIVLTPTRLLRRNAGAARITQPGPATLDVRIDAEGPAAVLLTARQGDAVVSEVRSFLVAPVAETIERGDRLLADFGAPAPEGWPELRRRAEDLAAREAREAVDPEARAALYREARWAARSIAFSNPLLGFGRLIFVKRHTQQPYPDVCLNHMPWTSRPGGDICILSPLAPDGEVAPILRGAVGPGHVHGMDLSPDGQRVTFGFAKRPTNDPPAQWLNRAASYELRRSEEPIHIFEVGVDGSGLRQLTSGEWSDLDPTYLPNGDVAFVSERCAYSLQCNEFDKDETSCNIYAVRPDDGAVRRLTVSKDGDYLPHALDNGLLAYTRWEYHERLWANIQSIWVVRPDGTMADAIYKQHFNDPWALEEMRSIPGSDKLLAIATGHHTLPVGPLVIIDPKVGINDPAGIRIVTPGVMSPEGGMNGLAVPEGGVPGAGGLYATPVPLSDRHFLVSYTYGGMTDENGYALYLVDVHGTRELLYRDPDISSFYPLPLRPRPRPPVLSNATEPDQDDALCIVTNIYEGVEGIAPGQIRYLRIAEPVGWPYDNTYGGHRYEPDVKSVMVNWTPTRILGTVPVEPDGSAYFRVPVDTAVYFQALDENMMELQRMRSFINFQRGEVRACAGCHETRGVAPKNVPTVLALRHAPSAPEPPPWGADRVISFLRDVQPVFDRDCVACHSGLKPAGGLDFSGGLTERYNRCYETVNSARLIARSNVGEDAKVTPPLAFGSHKSRLIEVLRTTHQERVRLPEEDRLRLVTWVDANSPYDAEFINKRAEVPPYNLAADGALRQAIAEVHGRRCAQCHDPAQVTRLDWVDIRRPARSLFLLAPLSPEAGGTGKCGRVYADASDADYRLLFDKVTAAVRETWAKPRRDVVTLPRGDAFASAP